MTFAEIASSAMPSPGERKPFGAFATVRELGRNDVQQLIGGDMAARPLGVESESKLFNCDCYHPVYPPLCSPPALLFAFEPSAETLPRTPRSRRSHPNP